MGLRGALRQIARAPWVALGIVAVLATSVAVSTALFAVIDALLIKRLPLAGVDRLVAVERVLPADGSAAPLAPVHLDAAASLPGVRALTAYAQLGRVEWHGHVIRQSGVLPTFFETLRVQADAGRLIQRGDGAVEGLIPAVVGRPLWTRLREQTPGLDVGGSVRIGNATYVIVGVAPAAFDFPRGTSLWIPLSDRTLLESATFNYLSGLAVLDSPPSGRREVVARERFRLTPLEEHERPSGAVPVAALLGMSCIVLVVGWLQVSTLQIGAAAGRARDYQLMTALGARGRHLVAAAMADTTLLGGGAVLLGLVVSIPLLDAIVAALPPDFLAGRHVAVDWRAAAFGAGVALAGLLACGGALAHVLGRLAAIRMATDRAAEGPRPWAGTPYLLGAQVLVAAALLYVSGVCVRSVANIVFAPLGFEPAHLYALSAVDANGADATGAAVAGAAEALAAVEGRRAVATAYAAPFGGLSLLTIVETEDRLRSVQAEANYVGAEYLSLLRVQLRSGRTLEPIDAGAAEASAVLGETAARALGVSLENGRTRYVAVLGQRCRVVGVIGDVKTAGPETAAPAQIYLLQGTGLPARVVVARLATPEALERAGAILRRSLPGATVNVRALNTAAEQWTAPHRGRAIILSIVSLGAWLVTLLGLYAAAASGARLRFKDTAIRLALGASSRQVVVAAGQPLLVAVAAGAMAGVAGGVAISSVVRSVLFGIPAVDVLGMATSVVVLFVCGTVAVVGPLYRISRLDLVPALRET